MLNLVVRKVTARLIRLSTCDHLRSAQDTEIWTRLNITPHVHVLSCPSLLPSVSYTAACAYHFSASINLISLLKTLQALPRHNHICICSYFTKRHVLFSMEARSFKCHYKLWRFIALHNNAKFHNPRHERVTASTFHTHTVYTAHWVEYLQSALYSVIVRIQMDTLPELRHRRVGVAPSEPNPKCCGMMTRYVKKKTILY
jgi:hypothetical protein